jgi:tetratricopeptide (TPR) repeat protein
MGNHSLRVSRIALALGLVVVGAPASASPQQEPGAAPSASQAQPNSTSLPELKLGQPVERELKGGETHSYRVDLQAGRFLQVVVNQKGIDVIVALTAPDMTPIVEMRTPTGDRRPERVSLIAQTSGSYRVDVRSDDKQAQPGPYNVSVVDVRQATPQDRDRVAGERLFIEGTQLLARQTKEGFTGAISRYAKALVLYRSAADRGGEASTLAYAGDAYVYIGENHQALDYYNRSLPLARAVGDRDGEAETLNNIGVVYDELDEKQRALDYYNEALPLRRIGGRSGRRS